MRSKVLLTGCLLAPLLVYAGSSGAPLTFPQTRAANYEEILKHQELGRFVVAPDGSFFIFEWSRPYDWVPDYAGLPNAVRARKQTFLYMVAAPDALEWFRVATSKALIQAKPGATYYLGALSPNGKSISFYELDWDRKKAAVGVAAISSDTQEKITWFGLPPDPAQLDRPAIWSSDTELLYPLQGRARVARANLLTGAAGPCNDCDISGVLTPTSGARISTAVHSRPKLPEAARKVAESRSGNLEIFVVDTGDRLSVLYTKKGALYTVLDNQRPAAGISGAESGSARAR